MVKRPQGLSKAARSKRARSEPDQNETKTEAIAEDELTVPLGNDIDENDDISQLFALYDTLCAEEIGPRQMKLLQGVIHECDRILRASAQEKEQKVSIPAEFHDVYAQALLKFARYAIEQEQDEPAAFISEALDRSSIGVEAFPEHAPLWFTQARIRIAEVDEKMSSSKPSRRYKTAVELLPTLQKALDDYEKGEALAFASDPKSYEPDQLDVISDLLQIGELFGELEDSEGGKLSAAKEKYLSWSHRRWQQVLENMPAGKGKSKAGDDDNCFTIVRKANRGMGQYYLALSMPIVNRIEGSDDEDDEDDEGDEDDDASPVSEAEIEKAKQFLGKAIEYLLKSETDEEPQTLVEAAEAQLNLANMLDEDSQEQKLLYAEAVSRLKRAQRLGHGNYQELIADLEE